MATHSSILAWQFHGQKSLAGYSPGDRKELDTTESVRAHTHTPLQKKFANLALNK